MFIAVVNQKGGVGKTTLAVHLATWLHETGRSVAFIDADGQASSSRWLARAEPDIACRVETDADSLIHTAVNLRREHDAVIADGPANLADVTRALLLVADVAVIPCGPSLPELESAMATTRVLRSAQAVRSFALPAPLLVLTRLRDDRCRLTREAPEAARSLGVPVCSAVLKLREVTADSPGQRTVVWRLGPRARLAAAEMHSVLREVIAYAQHTTEHLANADLRTACIPEAR